MTDRQMADYLNASRNGMQIEMEFAMLFQFGFSGLVARFEDRFRHRRESKQRVRFGAAERLLHAGMPVQDALDRRRVDQFAAAFEHAIKPTVKADSAAIIFQHQIVGEEKSIVFQSRVASIWLQVAEKNARPPQGQPSDGRGHIRIADRINAPFDVRVWNASAAFSEPACVNVVM